MAVFHTKILVLSFTVCAPYTLNPSLLQGQEAAKHRDAAFVWTLCTRTYTCSHRWPWTSTGLNCTGLLTYAKRLSRVRLCSPVDYSPPGSLPNGSSRQESGGGFSCRFPTQGSNPHRLCLPALAGWFFPTSTAWEAPADMQTFLSMCF